MILFYSDVNEVKWVDYRPKYCIGIRAKYLTLHINHLPDKVILFGSCGRLDSNLRDYSELIIPAGWTNKEKWIYTDGNDGYGVTTDHSVKHKWERQALSLQGFRYVDQESYHVAKLCQKLGVEFISVRYMIDRCDRKAMPIGINHFWRKYQHKRMQLKFNKWLEENK